MAAHRNCCTIFSYCLTKCAQTVKAGLSKKRIFKAENVLGWFKNAPIVPGPVFTISGLQRYLETSKTSKMELSVKIAAFSVNHFCKKLHLRCLAGF